MAGLRVNPGSRLWQAAVPPDSTTRRLGLAGLVDSVGTGLFLAGGTVFLARQVGLSSAQIGLGFGIAAVVGLGTLVPGGHLIDRFGAGRVFPVLQWYRAVAFAAYPFVSGFRSFLLVACLIAASESIFVPAIQAMVGTAVDSTKRVRTMAYLRSVNNVGYALGGALATLVLIGDSRLLFDLLLWADAASFAVSAVLLHSLARRTAGSPSSGGQKAARAEQPRRSPAWRNVSFVAAAMLNGVLCLHITMLSVGIPLWIVRHTGGLEGMIGPLLVLNTVLAVTLQVRLSRPAEQRAGPARVYRWAGLALAGSCLSLAVSGFSSRAGVAAIPLVVAVCLLTLGEIWQAAGQWGGAYAVAPEQQRGSYLAVYSVGVNVQRVAGPPLVAAVLVAGSAGWLGLGAVFVLAGAATAYLVTRAARCSVPGDGQTLSAAPSGAC